MHADVHIKYILHSYVYAYMCVLCARLFSCVPLFATVWTVVHQPPLSLVFSSQQYWSRLPFPPPGDLPNPGIAPVSPWSLALTGRFFTTEPPESPKYVHTYPQIQHGLESYRYISKWPQKSIEGVENGEGQALESLIFSFLNVCVIEIYMNIYVSI